MSSNSYSTIFNITDFGAVADGKTLCTEAFVAAIKACVERGGGTVYVPAGRFLTGPIHFQSNITLNLDAGARLLFSQDPADYPLVYTRWEGAECECYSPLLYGANLENIAVVGRGVLDGQGQPWWEKKWQNKLEYPRPRFIGFEKCQNVVLEGVTLVDSPSWTISPVRCENVTIDKITIINPAHSPNTDGIDPDSCKNVHISNCLVDVGDDCIAIKSGTEAGLERIPCENITITNCTMVHGHGGVVIGSEMSGGVRNVVISNCVFEGTDRGIRIKSRRGRGGLVEDVRVDNIIIKGSISPIVMHKFYHCGEGGKEERVWDKNPHPVDATTPAFRRIHFSNITAREVTAAAGFLYGLPEFPISDVSFDNISIHLAKEAKPEKPAMMCHLEPMQRQGFICNYVKNVSFKNVTIINHDGAAFQINNSQNIEISNCTTADADLAEPVIVLNNVDQAVIQASLLAKGLKTFLKVQGEASQGIGLVGRSVPQEQVSVGDGASQNALIK
ncbi:MAG TPA: glycoside hydrolase family 28 protein [Bacillota bacterium]|nr:glycoside hydrolase family 28 protein [Bacillota bacterium]